MRERKRGNPINLESIGATTGDNKCKDLDLTGVGTQPRFTHLQVEIRPIRAELSLLRTFCFSGNRIANRRRRRRRTSRST